MQLRPVQIFLFSSSPIDSDYISLISDYFSAVPRCLMKDEKTTFGANIGSKLKVKCTVDSSPAPSSFSWGFNNTKDAVKMDRTLFTVEGSSSVLDYHLVSDHQFGHLYCWARNSMGLMSNPCVFNIIPATRPNYPVNCVVLNQTTDVLQVRYIYQAMSQLTIWYWFLIMSSLQQNMIRMFKISGHNSIKQEIS